MTFVIGPFRLVKGENAWEELRAVLPALQDAAINRATAIWPGFTFGGVRPDDGEFGIATIRPTDVYGGGTATWLKSYGSQGSWSNIWSYTVPRDEVHAFAGIHVIDPTIIFSALRMQFEDRLYPIINIEEAQVYNQGFSIIWKQDQGEELVVSELKSVLLRGFMERSTRGRQQRIVPIGFMLYKAKSLALTEKETSN